jgi:hypothetical protein
MLIVVLRRLGVAVDHGLHVRQVISGREVHLRVGHAHGVHGLHGVRGHEHAARAQHRAASAGEGSVPVDPGTRRTCVLEWIWQAVEHFDLSHHGANALEVLLGLSSLALVLCRLPAL